MNGIVAGHGLVSYVGAGLITMATATPNLAPRINGTLPKRRYPVRYKKDRNGNANRLPKTLSESGSPITTF
ncbi:MAG: hypothetical protein CMJ62_06440 [Planctomycetaceae bacterium]|nr:hypothetical protein [Planctomycetaceae bacterium]